MAAARAKTRRSGGSWGGDKDAEDKREELFGDDSFNPNDVMYTGGTPTAGYAYQHPVEKAAGTALPVAVKAALPNLVPPPLQRGLSRHLDPEQSLYRGSPS